MIGNDICPLLGPLGKVVGMRDIHKTRYVCGDPRILRSETCGVQPPEIYPRIRLLFNDSFTLVGLKSMCSP